MFGIRGVLVPGEQSGPFRVKRSMGDHIVREDDLDVGSGSEVDEAVIQQKHEALEQHMDEIYESSCVGLVHAALLAASSAFEPASVKASRPARQKKRLCPIVNPEEAMEFDNHFCLGAIASDDEDLSPMSCMLVEALAIATSDLRLPLPTSGF
jgi:hypothetical protein